jgi:hypothetical protein
LNLESICLLGLLRFPDQLEPSLKQLADPVREEAEKTLSSLKQLPKPELLRRWAKLREEEWTKLGESAVTAMGLQLNALAPAFRLWVASWLVDHHG